jgi:hypothetical protein
MDSRRSDPGAVAQASAWPPRSRRRSSRDQAGFPESGVPELGSPGEVPPGGWRGRPEAARQPGPHPALRPAHAARSWPTEPTTDRIS